ncbi:hypothetical protein Daesc_010251 [Daldinia eschscholtzii]|uniref:Uncharacterized protein n=1 Tax=Daldinia eschscholtzii TaxID=292717 RepID=A0AAX6M7R2_9PEZI
MRESKTLRRALGLMEGLTFESLGQLSKDPDHILTPFVIAGFDKLTPKEIHDAISNPVRMLFLVCARSEDVYIRFRGDASFYYLLQSDWNSATLASPFTATQLGKLVSLFVGARRRYLAGEHSSEESSDLTRAIDRFIVVVDKVDSTIETRRVPGFKAPKDFAGTRSWPPDFFSKLDVAILAETTTRKDLFGIDYQNKGNEKDAPLYPHDQSLPLEVRKYLCWLSLTETKPNSKVALFLSPVAFNSHKQRQEWYGPTGHKSRFYATVDEFFDYAKIESEKTGKGAKQHVICLLTPWFFDMEALILDAANRGETIPIRWKNGCFRAGMVLCLTKLARESSRWIYQLTLFKPGLPHYRLAAEPSYRREKHNAWVEEFLDKVKKNFIVKRAWIGGRSQEHMEAPASRNVTADSVEVSHEFITEIMENPNTLPVTHAEHIGRGFEAIDV